MLKKLQLKNNTAKIALILLLFMVTSILVIPVFVSGQEDQQNDYYIGINDDDGDDDDDDDDEDDDGISDDDEEENERSIEIEVDGTEAQINSERESGENSNSFQVALHAESDKLAIEFSFDAETEIEESESEIELEYSIEFTQLIGYNDTNGDNYYSPENDTTVETYEIGEFEDIEYTYQNNTQGELHILSVISTDGKFGIIIYVSNEFITINETLLTPAEIKFDILITGFVGDFERVALKTELEFEGETEYDDETEDEENDYADNESELELNFNDYKGYFSWSEIATTDGVEHPVYHTPYDSSEEEQYIYLNYVAGNEIVHDPKVGVASILIRTPLGLIFGLLFPELSKNGFLISSAIAALVAISFSAVALRRRKKN